MDEKRLYVLAGYDDETEIKLSALQESLYARGWKACTCTSSGRRGTF